jgi:4a-hydroxytetrahydrobiopterin dehydratase
MKLSAEEITERLKGISGWAWRDDALAARYTFDAFADAVAFIVRLAFEAEAADHHPDLVVSYRRVTVRWQTHSEGGVTDKDFTGVTQADRVARGFGAHASQDEL